MNEEQSQALRLLGERADAHPEHLASVEGINRGLLGELFRRGLISKPVRGMVSMRRGGAALVIDIQQRRERDAALGDDDIDH